MRLTDDTPLVFLDTETTGTHHLRDRVIEVAAVRVEGGVEVARLDALVDPGTRIPPWITDITGIAQEDVAGARSFAEVLPELAELLEGAVLVAHNARFDHGFLKAEFARAEERLSVRTLCTVRLSRKLFPEQPRHRLDDLAARCGFGFSRRHRAMDDTRALLAWWQHARQEAGDERVLELAGAILTQPALPPGLGEDAIGALPQGPGVYLFYGEGDELLYVGKSVRIRDRVRSHFSQDYVSSKELRMAGSVVRVEHEETAGEIGALLRESALVKELQPTYNRQLRHATSLVVLERETEATGYERLRLRRVARLDAEDSATRVAFARTVHAAREQLEGLTRKHRLCQALTGSGKVTGSPCFAQTLGWCLGACTGAEDAAAYNARVRLLCQETGMRSWPHEGAVTVTERHPSRRFSDTFVLDQWHVTERRRVDHETGSEEVERYEARLDLDAFKIIDKALRKAKPAPLPDEDIVLVDEAAS